jgi:hypothetical protein
MMDAVMGGAEDAEVVAKVALALEARFAPGWLSGRC